MRCHGISLARARRSAGSRERTFRAYRDDLADFTRFLGSATLEEAARSLLAAGLGAANATVLRYRAHLLERGLAPASVNRHLAALRSLVKLARTLGLVGWTLEVPGVKAEAYRDTGGPGLTGVRSLVDALDARQDSKGARDRVGCAPAVRSRATEGRGGWPRRG